MRILITGGTGFIGMPLIMKLLAHGYQILVLSRKKTLNFPQNNLQLIFGDLNEPKSYQSAVMNFLPEVIIHLAWQDIPDYSLENSLINQKQALDFLNFLTGLESCKKIIVSGSCWEFDQFKGECSENNVGEPYNGFTWAKHSIRSWLKVRCAEKDIAYVWFRIFYAFGPQQREASIIPSIIKSLRVSKLPKINKPFNSNDFIYIDDIVEAFVASISKNVPSGIYNLGTGVSTSVLEICGMAERLILDSSSLTEKLKRSIKKEGDEVDFWASTKVSKKQLSWEAKTSIFEGIKLITQTIK